MKRRQEDWFGPHELHLGVDVGKSFHWAVGLDQEGEIRISRRVENRLDDVDALLEEAGDAALVVVDQKNNIGSLVVRRCRVKGIDVGYLPGKSMKSAREMLPGTAKNDRIDAEVIAQAGMSLRCAVLPIADTDDLGASMSLLSSQLAYATRRATMARNRLHAVLLESDPAFEAAADLSAAWTLDVLAAFGGAAGIAAAGVNGNLEATSQGKAIFHPGQCASTIQVNTASPSRAARIRSVRICGDGSGGSQDGDQPDRRDGYAQGDGRAPQLLGDGTQIRDGPAYGREVLEGRRRDGGRALCKAQRLRQIQG
jgi:hypothetical protein